MADGEWFYTQSGQQAGPMSLDALKAMVTSGQLHPADMVWTEGLPQWVRVDARSDLFGAVAQPVAASIAYAAAPSANAGTPLNYYGTVGRVAPYAGFWIRVGAYLIDYIITYIATVIAGGVLGFTIGIAMHGSPQRQVVVAAQVVGFVVGIIMVWLYYAFMESSAKQATLGKMACGLIVTDEAGGRISFGRATGRYFGMILSSLILCIGFMMVGWTEKKQGLHDLLAKTLVVKKTV